MTVEMMFNFLSNMMFVLCGCVTMFAAFKGLKLNEKRIGTFLFWTIVSSIFILGPLLPYKVIGVLIIIMSILTATKQVKMALFDPIEEIAMLKQSQKIGNKIFIPTVTIGIAAVLLSFIKVKSSVDPDVLISLPSVVSIGGGALIALVIGVMIVKPKVKDVYQDTTKLIMQVGPAGFLPQLLAALGAVFTAAGVGEVISRGVSNIVPENNIMIGIIIYVLAMALFTMIMGNGFAAFSVITIGVGIPFVIANGGNPAVVGALGLTSGYCGTLMTPMAANFNIVPTSILETKDKNIVMKSQAPIAICLIVIHIILMRILAF